MSYSISVEELQSLPEARFRVTVVGDQESVHEVAVAQKDYDRLHMGDESAAVLIRRSFEFLLERESNTSILRSFDLPLIGSYFPEYEEMIRQ